MGWARDREEVPLWKMVGGSLSQINCGVSIGIQESPEQLLEKIAVELDAGYQRIKVKVKPGWDVNVLEKIRQRWPAITLSCDANSAYTLDDVGSSEEVRCLRLLMIEQPLWNDDIAVHAKLQPQLKTAICLDESILQRSRCGRRRSKFGACRIINIKLGRVGGFTEAIATHDVCREAGITVWCGGMLEAGIGRAHNIAMSTLSNFKLPGDVSASAATGKRTSLNLR